MDSLSGQVVKGYELRERIGAGGFGAVYRAQQSTVGREVAIKIILPGFANQPDFVRRFEAEAQIIARLEHLHIVPLYDYWRDPDGAYLVMRWLRGGSLRDVLQRGGTYTVEDAAALLDQIASALNAAHQQHVIHRDLKPGNILLDEDSNAYLADFGIAKDLSNFKDKTTQVDAIVGSPDYLSPEQARSEAVTPQTDIYSLGVVLYELLTGKHPFPNLSAVERLYKHLNESLPTIDGLHADVKDAVNAVIQKATAKNPAHRYTDALAMAAAFREAIALGADTSPVAIIEVLTPREQQILQYIVEGRSNKDIAGQLFVTVATVKWYITQIYHKLGVRSRVQAIIRAGELQLISKGFRHDGDPTTSATQIPTDLFKPDNPYKGLRPFETADHRDFFGRETLTARLVKRLGETIEMSRFLAVVGPSGSGKSSVVKSGLIPALWRGDLPGSERWYVVEMVPSARPLDELEVALTRLATVSAGNLHEQLQRDVFGLIRAAGLILPNDGSELVLIVDQFEEVFTLVEDEAARAHFLGLIRAAVTEPRSRIRIIVSLRADFYDRPLHYAEFGELVRNRTETVLPLAAKEIQRAIAAPAERVGVHFEEGLVDTIVEDMLYQVGALPLMQYALTELFERRQGKLLTRAAYQEIGGAVGALAKRADDLFREFPPAGQDAVRQIFLRLVTVSDGMENTRRRAVRSELMMLGSDSEVIEEIIDTFATYRLLSLDKDPVTHTPTVEVAHEAILREWDRLRVWLKESRGEIILQRQLNRATQEWATSGRDASFLLRGTRLAQVEAWASSTALALTSEEREFLRTSVDTRTTEQAVEQARQAKELRLEHRSRNVLRVLVAVLFMSTVGALLLYAFADEQRISAERNAALSQSLALASGAQTALIEGNNDQSLALAIAANQIDMPPAFSQRILFESAMAPGTIRQMPCAAHFCFAMDVSPDERTVLTGGDNGEVVLSDIVTGEPIRTFRGHRESVGWGISFLPNGKRFISAGFDDLMLLWDTETGEILRRYESGRNDFNQIDVSPDGRLVAAATEDGIGQIWDIESGDLLRELEGHDTRVQIVAVAFSPDGKTVLTGSEDATMILWDVETGAFLRRFEGHTNAVVGVHFSPNGLTAISASFDNSLILWEVATGEIVRRFVGHTNWVFNAAFTPDGARVLSASRDGTLIEWDASTAVPLHTYTGDASFVLNVKLLAAGSQAISSHSSGTLRVWQLNAQDGIAQFGVLSEAQVHEVIDDTTLADGSVLALSRNGRLVAAPGGGADANIALLWDLDSRALLHRFAGHSNDLSYIGFSADERQLITAGWDNAIIIWDIETGAELRQFVGHTGAVFDVAFSPDGRQMVSGAEDHSMILWDTETASVLRRIEGFSDAVNTVAYSPDGKMLLAGFGTIRAVAEGNEDYSIRLFDAITGVELRRMEGHDGPVTAAQFSVDGERILTGSTDATVRLWDVETARELRRFSGQATAVWSIDMRNDGKVIAAGSQDGTVLVWNVSTGDVVRRYVAFPAMVYGVGFISDEDALISADASGMINLWNLSLDLTTLLDWTSRNRYVRDLSCSEQELYRLAETCDVMRGESR